MVTKQEFTDIHKEVQEAVQEALDYLRYKNPNNYALFLAKGEYDVKKKQPIIDSRMDRYIDESRITFLIGFLKQFYSFPVCQSKVNDDLFRMNIELMIYTHIWESKPFLKELYRLAHLVNGEDYDWKYVVPDNVSREDLIRNNIRATFDKVSLKIKDVIEKGFHTSLRNAFAHSEYSFDTMNGRTRIWLHNYKGKLWELQEISFDDWSKRFAYSALLSYQFLVLTIANRKKIIDDLKSDEFTISIPFTQQVQYKIYYDNKGDNFHEYRPTITPNA